MNSPRTQDEGLAAPSAKPSLESLHHELSEWCATENVAVGNPRRHILDESLTNEQRAWLFNYIERLDTALKVEAMNRFKS